MVWHETLRCTTRNRIGIIVPAALVLVTSLIYHGWFMSGVITWGDWTYYTRASRLDWWPLSPLTSGMWDIGQYRLLDAPKDPLLSIDGLLANVGVDYSWTERLIWIAPIILLAPLGPYLLSYSLFRNRAIAVVSALFAVANSYIYILNTGGQMSMTVAYSFIPLILWSFRTAMYSGRRLYYVLTALLLTIQPMYDVRPLYITIWMLILYVPFILLDSSRSVPLPRSLLRLIAQGAIATVIGLLVHAYWILPELLVRSAQLPSSYTTVNAVRALSFSQLADGLALFHPFWPQNTGSLFGIDPVFFAISLLVLSSFMRKKTNADILYFSSMCMIAIFFVKGDNPPAGGIYDWLFIHVPGFSIFRESSKFYQPLMVSASILAGLAVVDGLRLLRKQLSGRIRISGSATWAALCAVLIVYPSLPVAAAPFGTVLPRQVPRDYARLNALIDNQNQFFRVLWFPGFIRFGTFSQLHPALSAWSDGLILYNSLIPNSSDYSSWLRLPNVEHSLQALSVKYVIVPSDPFHQKYQTTSASNLGITQQQSVTAVRRAFRGFHEFTIGSNYVFVNPHYLPQVYVADQTMIESTPLGVAQPTTATLIRPSGVGHSAPALAATIDPRLASNVTRMVYSAPRSALPTIRVRALGTDRLAIDVRGATRPFMALLLQAYDPNWRAYIEPLGADPTWWSLLHSHPMSQRTHMRADGYANGWWVDTPGSFTLVLAFWPQGLALIGAAISWLTLLCVVAYLLVSIWRGSRRGRGAGHSVRGRSLVEHDER